MAGTTEKVSVIINGQSFPGFKVMNSFQANVCDATGERIKKGEQIAYKKDASIAAMLRKSFDGIVVKWPQGRQVTQAPAIMAHKTAPTFKPSEEQEAIYNAAIRLSQHLIVKARAGTGKTTTMAGMFFRLFAVRPELTGQCAMIVFGNKNAAEMAEKLPPGVIASTIHSFGNKALKGAWPKAELVGVKPRKFKKFQKARVYQTLDRLVPEDANDDLIKAKRAVPALVSMAKQYALLPNQLSELDKLIDHEIKPIDLFGADREIVVDLANKVLTDHLPARGQALEIYDLDDMIWLPAVVPGLTFPRYALVVVDEVQDVNPAMLLIMAKLVNQGTRLLVVGDPEQSIMGFRGSDLQAFKKVEDLLNDSDAGAKTLPLTINRRCGRIHIENVRWRVPDIQADPNAPMGTLEEATLGQFFYSVRKNQAVLVRTNALGIAIARNLRCRRIPCVMKGREEDGSKLINLVDQLTGGRNVSVIEFLQLVQQHNTNVSAEINKAAKPSQFKLNALNEDCDSLTMIATSEDGNGSPVVDSDDVKNWIFTLYNDDVPAEEVVTISTIHRSKGLEFPVVWYSPIKSPHPSAGTQAALEQEYNLMYVCMTRIRADHKLPGSGRLIRLNGDPTAEGVNKLPPDETPLDMAEITSGPEALPAMEE